MTRRLGVWFPAIRAGSGADVFTERLCSALNVRGVRAEITWLPLRAEYAPWSVPVPQPPGWATVAQVYPHAQRASDAHPHEVRIAFDGDAVLFSDEAERVFQAEGLDAFQAHETAKATQPLPGGPFKPLLEALHRLQQEGTDAMRIRTALVTARSAPAHERAIRTLMDSRIEVDEAMFLGGLPKGEFLREFEPDFFFDDQTRHVRSAAEHVPAGHVAAGVMGG